VSNDSTAGFLDCGPSQLAVAVTGPITIAPGAPLKGRDVAPGVVYDHDGLKITAFDVDHGGVISPAYGYRVDYQGRSAVFSGDTVRRDAEGFLYFVGRNDEMIKTSGYRISPTEIEEVLYATRLVGECVAFGVEHAVLGQAVHVIATPPPNGGEIDMVALMQQCRVHMPAYMVPAAVEVRAGPLPRNPNGKIDRKLLSTEVLARMAAPT
jgi:acyl-CoA synthetase (AMP-forming)/AMP-acid ligase II